MALNEVVVERLLFPAVGHRDRGKVVTKWHKLHWEWLTRWRKTWFKVKRSFVSQVIGQRSTIDTAGDCRNKGMYTPRMPTMEIWLIFAFTVIKYNGKPRGHPLPTEHEATTLTVYICGFNWLSSPTRCRTAERICIGLLLLYYTLFHHLRLSLPIV